VWHAGAGVRLGGNIPAVSGGAGGDVVAVQPRAGLAVQVHTHLTQLVIDQSLKTKTKIKIEAYFYLSYGYEQMCDVYDWHVVGACV